MVAGDGGRHRRARHRPRVQGGRDRDVYRPRGASPLRERRGDGRELQRTARGGARPAGRGRRARLHRPVTVADWLAIFRAFAVIPIVLAIAAGERTVALAVFAVAAATDALDGWLARRSGSATPRGAFIDPLADKVLVVGTLVAGAALVGLAFLLSLVSLPRYFATRVV